MASSKRSLIGRIERIEEELDINWTRIQRAIDSGDSTTLTDAELEFLLAKYPMPDTAFERLKLVGVSDEDIQFMRAVQYDNISWPGTYLAIAEGETTIADWQAIAENRWDDVSAEAAESWRKALLEECQSLGTQLVYKSPAAEQIAAFHSRLQAVAPAVLALRQREAALDEQFTQTAWASGSQVAGRA